MQLDGWALGLSTSCYLKSAQTTNDLLHTNCWLPHIQKDVLLYKSFEPALFVELFNYALLSGYFVASVVWKNLQSLFLWLDVPQHVASTNGSMSCLGLCSQAPDCYNIWCGKLIRKTPIQVLEDLAGVSHVWAEELAQPVTDAAFKQVGSSDNTTCKLGATSCVLSCVLN